MAYDTSLYDTVNVAFDKLLQRINYSPQTQYIKVFESPGYVLKEDIIAKSDVPLYSTSHMDGFALKSCETLPASKSNPVEFKISTAISILGKSTFHILKNGEAYRIQTGGYLPSGADAIVPIENVNQINDNNISINNPCKKGQFIFEKGEDIKNKEIILKKGQTIRIQDASYITNLNYCTVPVFRKPRIAIIPTGTELTDEIKENNDQNKVINTNSPIIAKIIDEIGGISMDYGVTPDEQDILKRKIDSSLKESDIVITIGGSSAGKQDIVEKTINLMGDPGVIVHGVKLDRGRVSGLAVINNKPIIILPGPIQGTLNGFIVFVRPLIRLFLGQSQKNNFVIHAIMTNNWSAREKFKNFTKILYVRVSRESFGFKATPNIGETQSISLLVKSNGYVILSEGKTNIESGEIVEVNLIPGFSYIKDSSI